MRVLVIAAVLIGLAGPAAARDATIATPPAAQPAPVPAERMALAREVMAAGGGTAAFQGMVDKLTLPAKDEAADTTAAMAPSRADMRKKMMVVMPDIIDAVTLIYARTFSDAELRAMLDYARSPIGQSVHAKRMRVLELMTPETMWALAAIGTEDGDKPTEPPPLPSPQPSAKSLALAARYVAVSGTAERVADTPFALGRVMTTITALMPPGSGLEPTATDDAATLRMKARAKALIPEFARRAAWIYAGVYSDEELQGQIDYLLTPAGQAQLRLKPVVEAEVQKAIVSIIQRMMAGG